MSTNFPAKSVICRAAIVATLLSGCRDPAVTDVSHATSRRPKPLDLVGRYVPDAATRELISSGGYPDRTISIELDADGALRVTNIPDWWELPADVHQTGFDSGSGTWELYNIDPLEHQGPWGLMLDFPSMANFDSDRWRAAAEARPADNPDVGLRTSVILVGEQPPYIIELALRRRGFSGTMRFTKVPSGGGDG